MLLRLLICLLWLLPITTISHAGEVKVAVAANFTEPAKDIAAAFKARTGHEASLSFGPSGQFYTQIMNGAPYEVFMSADAERPIKAELEGLGVNGTRFVYAYGALVLWSADPKLIDPKGAVLKRAKFSKIAIADPGTAPYGVAAVETLKKLGIYEAVAPKIVKGTSIAQTYNFVSTGSAELGFVASSQVYRTKAGSRWIVPKSYYTPIDQQVILLKTGDKNPAARAWLTFLKSQEAIRIIRSYGYEVR
ncbi:molybdate ABC transporter substrate-binding protein [Asticcacaulis endophyticus]|uniref:Molybdate ABC transporter substrate-binding protein n=1 Tax=Asticcacaulis endophyticus TaxID=1395890 RepID=A0A918PXJ6_9CAUL|nr:molybdate ABC transporter substrate-binding protein [Asticcacaulis endophyticus]GGZ26724.1 molybdate ABC transporter substrate-binding protein [Asticcacaulis endophyticus]